jgi:cytochrome c oxidase subunit 4
MLSDEPIKVPAVSEHAHPGPAVYVKVAIILALVTAAEVAIYYIDMSDALLVTLLLFFSFIKFVLVVLWFMHLKFDSPMFRRLFVTGVVLAVSVYAIVLATFLLR